MAPRYGERDLAEERRQIAREYKREQLEREQAAHAETIRKAAQAVRDKRRI